MKPSDKEMVKLVSWESHEEKHRKTDITLLLCISTTFRVLRAHLIAVLNTFFGPFPTFLLILNIFSDFLSEIKKKHLKTIDLKK